MRVFSTLITVFLISLNVQAAPENTPTSIVDEMFTGYYRCQPLSASDFRESLGFDVNTHMRSEDNDAYRNGSFDCDAELAEFIALIESNCSYVLYGYENRDMRYVCRGTRGEIVELTAKMFEQIFLQ